MSYQVIARKYRPQTFSDLAGQEHITRTLGNALEKGRLHHAYLFSGVRGTGKTTTARILAKGLNCRTGVTNTPCLECPSCIEIARGNSLDVLEIDAASNTGVDNVRDIVINNIAMLPARDRYKVFVIDEVHMLSTSAFNALLKTLEEPPSHVVFIMATTELHKVPDTILSRCQQFEFRQIATEKIFRRLREIADNEGIIINDAALREVARAGAGSLRDAQSALDQVIAFSGAEITEEDVTSSLGLVSAATLGRFTEAIAARDSAMVLALIEEVASRGYDFRNFTRELMAYLRHLLVVKSGITSSETLGVADVEIDHLKQLASLFSEEDLIRCFHLLSETEKAIKDSPHPRFQLEIGLVKLAQAIRLRTLDELVAGLKELESKLNSSLGGDRPSAAGSATGENRIESSDKRPRPPSLDDSAKHKTGLSATDSTRSIVSQLSDLPQASVSPPRAASTITNEPPDFPDFDMSEPVDFPGIETPPAPSVQSAAKTNVVPGHELTCILNELQRIKPGLIAVAIEDAQDVQYHEGQLIVTFGSEGVLAKRLRDSANLFREIGDRLLGQPIRVTVKISGQIEERIDETEVKRRQLHQRALQNPAVKIILETMRGELLSVRKKETPGQ